VSKLALTTAVAGAAAFGTLVAALHVLRPDLDPMAHPTSQYAAGRFGYVMTLAFLSMSVASLGLAVGLSRREVAPDGSLLGRVLLGYWAVAVLVAMLFPLNELGTEPTLSSRIHRINGPIAFLSVCIAAVTLSRRFSRDPRWQRVARVTQILSWSMVALFFVTGFAIARKTGFGGLCQRIQLVLFLGWFFITARHARTLDA
jgi:hypothetical protein